MNGEVFLPKKFALLLLHKLSVDNGFRSLYESDPQRALKKIGIPDEILSKLPTHSFRSVRLADSSVFSEALSMLVDDTASVSLCQIQPQIHVFSPIKGRGIKATIPFEAPASSLPADAGAYSAGVTQVEMENAAL